MPAGETSSARRTTGGERPTDRQPAGGAGTSGGAETSGGAFERDDDLLGELVLLDDVGPIRRQANPLARLLFGPFLIATAVLVAGLVLLPALWVMVQAVVSGSLWPDHEGSVWALDGIGQVWFRTLIWTVVEPALIIVVSLLLAALLRHRPGRVLGAALVAPAAVPLLVTGVAFRLLFHPDPGRGPATALLGFIPGETGWLGSAWITVSLLLAFTWVWLGLAVLVFRAALDRVPSTLSVVASASGRTRLRSATLAVFHDAYWQPALRRVAGVLYVLMAVMSARTLELILVVTPGSVMDDARTLGVLHFDQARSASGGTTSALGALWLATIAGVLAVAVWTWPTWPLAGGGRADPRRRRSAAAATGRARLWPVLRVAVVGWWLVPLLVLLATALHDRWDAARTGWRSWPGTDLLGSFGYLAAGAFLRSLLLTVGITVLACLITLVVAALAVEAFQDLPARAVRMVFAVMVAAAVVPVQVIAEPVRSGFNAVERWTPMAVPGTMQLIVVHLAFAVPLTIVLLMAGRARAYELAMRAWAEAPVGVGAGAALRRVFRAARELIRSLDEEPAVVAAVVLVFLQVWNDFVVGLFFARGYTTPLAVQLSGQVRQFVTNSGPLAAGSVVALSVPVAVVVSVHHRLIDGLIGSLGPGPDAGDGRR